MATSFGPCPHWKPRGNSVAKQGLARQPCDQSPYAARDSEDTVVGRPARLVGQQAQVAGLTRRCAVTHLLACWAVSDPAALWHTAQQAAPPDPQGWQLPIAAPQRSCRCNMRTVQCAVSMCMCVRASFFMLTAL